SIKLVASDEAKARAAIEAALAELERLEGIFSVYRADSAISTLNRDGRLDDAPADLVALLQKSLELARLSGGAYDPTIQPVWQAYFRHFTGATPAAEGPSQRDLDAALALVGWQNVEIGARRVAFARPGMAVTLNSGAQGYITDKVAEVLRGHGFDRMLVDMGEPRALSTKPDGTAWRIGIANPADPSKAVTEIDVVDKAVSTSGGYGTLFDDQGRFTHLIDPRSGRTAPALLGVSVVADTATQADGLSTALLLTPPDRQRELLRAAGGQMALTVTPQGVIGKVEA
ncbi:MAG TPA: FAD:protein FMN transferase, partial [Magnetospirillum sp.]|nr:FAD:protein FMN transferase [Magnetospirillum sp.]